MFANFKKSVSDKLDFLIANSSGLFEVDVDKDAFWELYLDSFPPGTNEIFRERREYDCSSCKSFVRMYGNIVGIIENKMVSIWDVFNEPLEEKYQVVAKALSDHIHTKEISNPFFSEFKHLGVDSNKEMINDEVITWNHFYYSLPNIFVHSSPDAAKGKYRQTRDVIHRGFTELKESSVLTVLDLIEDKILYRGEEHKESLTLFLDYLQAFDLLPLNERVNYTWVVAHLHGRRLAIRNTAIGTLLINLSEGMDLELAVKKYEQVVAPTNYKRPKAIFTKKMVEEAKETIANLGFSDSLGRRHAHLDDISVNNVLWASGESREVMKDPFDQLAEAIPVKQKSIPTGSEVTIEKFVEEILPGSTSIELFLENKFKGNLVNLIAPTNKQAPSLFKWNNPFSWAYHGDFADSIKEAVKAQGGKVDGALRLSLSWAEGDASDNSDLDAHCKTPVDYINFSHKKDYTTRGELDVDIRTPNSKGNVNIVENITWPDLRALVKGDYKFFVHNFSLRGNQKGFKAEIEFDGEIFEFDYQYPLKNKETVHVATVNWDGKRFTLKSMIDSQERVSEIWGVKTGTFVPVSTFMFSPNHWDDQGVGNRHYFFMLEGAKNPENPRGFFNEYLNSGLEKHRRVFEALGSQMRVASSNHQLAGVGFANTKDNQLTLKVDGKIITINFNTKNERISKSSEKKISL